MRSRRRICRSAAMRPATICAGVTRATDCSPAISARLQEDVIANRACPPNGAYRVVSRTPVLQHTTLIGVEIWKVVYDVECTS